MARAQKIRDPVKQLNLKLPDPVHHQIKVYCAKKRLTIKEFAVRAMLRVIALDSQAGDLPEVAGTETDDEGKS